MALDAAVDVVVALRFEGRARRQDGVEGVEVVRFHCSGKEKHNICVQKTHLSDLTKMGRTLSGVRWWLSVWIFCSLLLINLISSVLIRQVNANCCHWFDVHMATWRQRLGV